MIRRLEVIDSVDSDLPRARDGDAGARDRAYKRMLELAGTLHQLRDMQLAVRIEYRLDQVGSVCTGEEAESLKKLRADFAQAAGDDKTLRQIEDSLDDIDRRVRRKPYFDVLVDLMALGGRRVSASQHRLFEKADALTDRIRDKGGGEAMTDSDLAQLSAMHRELIDAHPQLTDWRAEALKKLHAEGRGSDDITEGDIRHQRD
jgi:hypothetical protein